MSGNNRNEWDKFLNGGSYNYNFSYRQEKAELMPVAGTSVTLAPMPAAASTVIPATKPTANMNLRVKNNRTQKVELPALKATSGRVQALKGGRSRVRRRHRKTRHGHKK
jgi:hypothetical protein